MRSNAFIYYRFRIYLKKNRSLFCGFFRIFFAQFTPKIMTKINISFFTRNIPKGVSVYARITFAGNEVKTSTGIVLQSLEQFSKKKMKIVKHPEADRLNLKLAKIETRIFEVFNFYSNKEILLTKELLLEGLKNNVRNKTTLYDYGRSWLKANQKRIAYGTYTQLLADLNKFDRFVPGIHISDIEKSILIRYHRYLISLKNRNCSLTLYKK